MTDKELLYVEDSLGHLKQLDAIIKDYSTKLNDLELTNLLNDLENQIKGMYQNIYSLLNV